MTNNKKIRRPGAGRTKGSFSFVAMTLEELAAANPNPTFKFLVSRKQMESLGISNLVTDKVGDLKESLAGQSVETAPVVKTEEF